MPFTNQPPKKKPKAPRADEVYQRGNIHFARFGRFIVAKNLSPPEYFEDIRKRAPDVIAGFEKEIRAGIQELRQTLSDLDPLAFLTNAYGEYFLAHLGVEDEPSLTEEHAFKLRMLDYCSSVFAATAAPPSTRRHTEADFECAKKSIKNIFSAARHYVLWSQLSDQDATNRENTAKSDLVTKLILQWIFIRSDRHAYFEIPHYTSTLMPLDSLLRRILGVSAAELINGLAKILANAQSGIADAGLLIKKVHEASTSHDDFIDVLDMPAERRTDEIAKLAGIEPHQFQEALEAFFGTRLFNIQLATGWPNELIDSLSYSPGDANEFLSPDEFAAWPTRIWPIFKRPFLKIDQYSYCFDYITFFDRFYRQILRILRERDSAATEEINRIQSKTTETTVADFFYKLLPGAQIYRNIYYQSNGEWCECDLCITYKDVILAVEVRSGALTPSSPNDDLASYFRSIEALILKPSVQAWRLLDTFANNNVQFFDSNRSDRALLVELRQRDFKLQIPVAVSLDPTHMMGAHYANTLAAMEASSHRPTWVFAVDDLRCFDVLLDSPSIFLHFAEMRLKAAAELSVDVHSEIDHLGLYFRENDYIQQTKDFDGRLSRVGYTSDIDKYIFGLSTGQSTPRPKQKIPKAVTELVAAADKSRINLTRLLTGIVLDADSDTRREIANWLDHQRLNPASEGRFRSLALFFGSQMLSLDVTSSWSKGAITKATDEAKARLLKSVDSNTCLVALLTMRPLSIEIADCVEFSKDEIPEFEADRLRPISQAQLERDFSVVKGKIGRNNLCPCASGLKYKKCCLRRGLYLARRAE
jgi:hypothetical protein